MDTDPTLPNSGFNGGSFLLDKWGDSIINQGFEEYVAKNGLPNPNTSNKRMSGPINTLQPRRKAPKEDGEKKGKGGFVIMATDEITVHHCLVSTIDWPVDKKVWEGAKYINDKNNWDRYVMIGIHENTEHMKSHIDFHRQTNYEIFISDRHNIFIDMIEQCSIKNGVDCSQLGDLYYEEMDSIEELNKQSVYGDEWPVSQWCEKHM